LRATKSLAELNEVLDEVGNCTVVEKIMQARDRKSGVLLFDEDDEPIMEEVYFINRASGVDMSTTRRTVTSVKEKKAVAKTFNWDARIAGL
jgi:predicted nucleotidyltransferase